jgi:PKD repeat protein
LYIFYSLVQRSINPFNALSRIPDRDRERIINYGNRTQIKLQDENTLQNRIGNRKSTIDIAVNGRRGNTFQFKMNQSVTFNASSTFDIDNDPLIFSWDFGDNTSGTGNIVTHSYSHEGTYQIRLTSDAELEDMMNITVTVIKTGSPGGSN